MSHNKKDRPLQCKCSKGLSFFSIFAIKKEIDVENKEQKRDVAE